MKNFRKVLALILVVATLFSFVAMASAKKAEEYADYAEITNVIPVEVITALGITEGYDGKYHPADTIDRDEVAAMIARLRNGGNFKADLYVGADNVFADVKGQWSEGYVTYCAQLGIINGLNATTFNPDGKITVVEAAKLLLCVLGYDAQLQGYAGNANWKVAVIRDAEKMGLLAGIPAADAYKEATRDQVALMFFNALKADLVYGYISENIVTYTNSLLKNTEWDVSVPDIADPKTELAYNNALISDVTLGQVVGVWDEPETDCFGRPGTRWGVGTAWSKFFKDAPAAATTDGSNPFAKAADIATVVRNGEVVDKDFALKNMMGKGVLAERYGSKLVLIDTFFTTVTAISTRYGTATLANGDVVSAAGLAVGNVLKYNVCDGSCVPAAADKTPAVWAEGHNHVGDYVHANAYTVVAPKAVVVDEVHTIGESAAASYIVGKDGAKYEYAKYLGHEVAVANDFERGTKDIMDWKAKSNSMDLYLDDYGYIQFWAPTPAAGAASKANQVLYFKPDSNEATFVPNYKDEELGNKYTFTADAVDMTGADVNDFAISKATYETMVADVLQANVNPIEKEGFLALFNPNNGEIIEKATFAGRTTYLDAANGELVNEKFAATGLNYHFDADTQFLVRVWDVFKGDFAYEAVTGYKTMPEYLGKAVFGDNNKINTIQFIDNDKDGYVDYMFIDAFFAKTTAEYIYVTARVEEIGMANLGNYIPEFSYYKGFVNGAEAYLAYMPIGWSGDLANNTLYKTVAKSINATYQGAPIYVVMEEAHEFDLMDANTYTDIKVKNGQIELYKNTGLEIVASNYLEDLTVYVVTDVTDGTVVAGAYTGAEFVAKYQNSEYFVETNFDVYGLGAPLNTLVLKIK